QFAAAKINAILVNINPAYLEGELKYVLQNAGCKALAMASRYRGADCTAAGVNARNECPQLEKLILMDDSRHEGFMSWRELVAQGRHRQAQVGDEVFECDPRAPAKLQYTSGTTGKPKGTTLSHYNMVNNAAQI